MSFGPVRDIDCGSYALEAVTSRFYVAGSSTEYGLEPDVGPELGLFVQFISTLQYKATLPPFPLKRPRVRH